MFKRTLSAIAVGAVLIAGSITSAQAIEITSGNYKIIFDNFDVGTVGYGDSAGEKCATIADCNTAATSKANGTAGDTAGILSVASITNLSSNVDEYIRGTSSTLGGFTVGPYLTGVFSGMEDFFVEVAMGQTGSTTTALATGGSFKLWSNSANYNPDNGPNLNPAIDLDTFNYAGITNADPLTLFLSGDFAPGVNQFFPDATYSTEYKNTGTSGNGSGYLDFTGGFAYDLFNKNNVANNIGGFNDAFLTVTYDNANGAATEKGWDVKSSGQISGDSNSIPEPGSLALISLAMLGLGATTARRRNKKG